MIYLDKVKGKLTERASLGLQTDLLIYAGIF